MQGYGGYPYQHQGYPSAADYADPSVAGYVDPSASYYYGAAVQQPMVHVPPVTGVPVPPMMGVPQVIIPGVPPVSGIPLPPGEGEEEVSEERKQRRKERKEAKERKNKLELSGNPDTMNLSELILNNIMGSTYFKGLYKLKTYHEIVDEIYYSVEHLEPWMPNSKMASQAWCLLYKCFTIKLTRKQAIGMLDHTDSPYIRGIGFLYLRMCTNPRLLWDWFEPYLADEEEIVVRYKGNPTTIGSFVEDLLTKNKFVDTVLPRFPAAVANEINERLAEWRRNNPGVVRKPTEMADDTPKAGQRRGGGSASSRSSSSSSRSRDADRDRDRDRRDRDRDRDRDNRDRDRDRDRRYKRSRSRSSERDRSRRDDRSRSSERRRDDDRDRKRARTSRSRSRSPPDQSSSQKKAPSAEHMERMRQLAAKYGSTTASSAPAPAQTKSASATEKDTMMLGGRRY